MITNAFGCCFGECGTGANECSVRSASDQEANPATYDENEYQKITEKDIPGDPEEYAESTKNARAFRMGPVEWLRYKKFCEDHGNCMRNPDGSHRFGAIGGGVSVTFMPTGLGNIVKVKCETCGRTYDLTDVNCW